MAASLTDLDARALRAPFAVAAGGDAAAVDTLERDGVVILVDNGRWIQFRHHLLFDFAAARILLDLDALIAGTRLTVETVDLVLEDLGPPRRQRARAQLIVELTRSFHVPAHG